MGTYIFKETEQMIERFKDMERRMTSVFNALQKNDVAAARDGLTAMAKAGKDDMFVLFPLFSALDYIARKEGPQVAAEMADGIAKKTGRSRINLDGRLLELKAVFENRAKPGGDIPRLEGVQDLPRFWDGMRRKMLGLDA